jgi:hypothetical protein
MAKRLALIAFLIAGIVALGRSAPVQSQVTFSEHVAPIIFNKCAGCHRPGEAAPFSLLSYDDVKKRGKLIATVTQSRYMPPWHATSDMGTFRDDRRLTDAQIQTIQQWVNSGMVEGDRKKLPVLREFTPGWQLGQPDLVIKMDQPFELPADGPDVFRNFAIKLNLKKDEWVKAVEFRSSARSSHHALFFLDQSGQAMKLDAADPKPGFGGMSFLAADTSADAATPAAPGIAGRVTAIMQRLRQRADSSRSGLGGWAVGGTPYPLPAGLARPLPQDSDFVLQMHFHPTGKIEKEQATIGLYFADAPPKRTLTALQMPPVFGALAGIDIPAGEKHFVIRDSFTLPLDTEVISVGGHAHYLAKDMVMTATLPGGSKRDLVKIPDWKFNWQERYYFKDPVKLPKGTRLDVEISYDNSKDNPSNPNNPPKRVTFGQQSTDEMGAVTIEMVPVNERDLPQYAGAVQQHVQEAVITRVTNAARALRGGQ